MHAEETRFDDYEKSKHFTERALKLSLRGRDYCWRGLEARFRGITPKLKSDPAAAVAGAQKAHVPLLYWSAASLGAAISLGGIDHPELLIDWPVVRALGERALALDESWGNGAIHELMMTVESQGDALGGSEERARKHSRAPSKSRRACRRAPISASRWALSRASRTARSSSKLLEQRAGDRPGKGSRQPSGHADHAEARAVVSGSHRRFVPGGVDMSEARPARQDSVLVWRRRWRRRAARRRARRR